jgi:hypothetical protein
MIFRYGVKAALIGTGLMLSFSALANPLVENDPSRPVAAISRDLGVTQDQFIACFHDVQPAPPGTHPTSQETHTNKAHLLGCLQQANPSITNQSLDTVMDRYRPGGHEAQEPEDR